MAMTEDPARQLNYLQQCLSSDKKPLGVFLGAGCPMAIRLKGREPGPLIRRTSKGLLTVFTPS